MQKFFPKTKGFTLLEVLIVASVLVIISSMGVGFYLNYGKSVEINSAAQTLVFDLKQAQSKAMIGEGYYKWGIHFVNGAADYYEIFSTPTDYSAVGKVITATNYLPGGVTFSDPAENSSKDIIFDKISGGTSANSVALAALDFTKTISVSSIGSISVQ